MLVPSKLTSPPTKRQPGRAYAIDESAMVDLPAPDSPINAST